MQRFANSRVLTKAINETVNRSGLSINDFDKIVYDAPADPRRHGQLAKKLGISREKLQDPFLESIGNTGTALATMMLVAALDEAVPGDRILFASYGNGADVYILKVTEAITNVNNRGTFSRQLKKKSMLLILDMSIGILLAVLKI